MTIDTTSSSTDTSRTQSFHQEQNTRHKGDRLHSLYIHRIPYIIYQLSICIYKIYVHSHDATTIRTTFGRVPSVGEAEQQK